MIDQPLWKPNPDHEDGTPNPQRLALESEADEVLYGGQAGGGKTSLLLGLAFTQHKRSVIFRRVYPNLTGIIQDSIDLIGNDEDYNKVSKTWQIDDRIIEFGAVQYEHNKNNWRGRPHDFYGFDELPEFSQSQYQFIIGWNRTIIPGQRCRVLATCNPPDTEEGRWIIDAWGPWLNDEHPEPAKPGELRWYYYDDDNIVWLRSGEAIEVKGEIIKPRSRTFIPAALSDNPYLTQDDTYRSVIQSMPEPLRSQLLYGDFKIGLKTDPWQVIPTSWVKLAQKRWTERIKPLTPLTAVGEDIARGGNDKLVIAKRYDNYFDTPVIHPGIDVEDGPAAAELARQAMGNEEPIYINIDIIGVGTSAYDSQKIMYKNVIPVNVGAGSEYRDRSDKLKMRNLRAEMYWRFREALDPVYGDDIALPTGNEVLADLCAARYTPTAAGIQIEPKEKIKERIGRSPDVGEAIMLAHLPMPPIDFLSGILAQGVTRGW